MQQPANTCIMRLEIQQILMTLLIQIQSKMGDKSLIHMKGMGKVPAALRIPKLQQFQILSYLMVRGLHLPSIAICTIMLELQAFGSTSTVRVEKMGIEFTHPTEDLVIQSTPQITAEPDGSLFIYMLLTMLETKLHMRLML